MDTYLRKVFSEIKKENTLVGRILAWENKGIRSENDFGLVIPQEIWQFEDIFYSRYNKNVFEGLRKNYGSEYPFLSQYANLDLMKSAVGNAENLETEVSMETIESDQEIQFHKNILNSYLSSKGILISEEEALKLHQNLVKSVYTARQKEKDRREKAIEQHKQFYEKVKRKEEEFRSGLGNILIGCKNC